MYGLKHNLTLVRKTDDDDICRLAAAGAGKVSLDKILWFMPHVIPADAEKFFIYKTIESKVKLPVAYRTSCYGCICCVPPRRNFPIIQSHTYGIDMFTTVCRMPLARALLLLLLQI